MSDTSSNEFVAPIEAYNSEKARLETFTDWPSADIVSPNDLAAAGFYYIKQNNKVKCAFCLEVISNWKSGDKPVDKHRPFRRRCSFIRGLPSGDIPCPPPTKYKCEVERYKTYADWPLTHIVSSEDLAAAGFYYTQRGDLVMCAFCSAAVYDWVPGDIPINKHISCNPNCGFIQDKDVGIIPRPSRTSYRCEQTRLNTFKDRTNSNYGFRKHLAAAGFCFTQFDDSIKCAFCLIVISDWKPNENTFDKHQLCNPTCRFIKGLPVGDIPCPPQKKFRNEAVRLKTFPSSVTWIVKPEDLADAGFYYSQRGNLFVCAFCSAGVYIWKRDTTAIIEHLSTNPTCRFILGKVIRNMADTPYALLKSEQARLETFTDWPSADIVSLEDLAAAGFYYTQQKDEVKCTFCDEAVCDWRIGENVLEKHRSRNKDCSFILGLPTADIPNNPLKRYKSEKTRLDTFTYWPKPHIAKPVDLAAAGFYYTRRGDLVRCAFCSAGAYHWQQGDTAIDKHRSCNPHCRFISGNLVGNIPHPSPKEYKCEKKRLETFTDWPVPHIVKPKDLAAAGFYYTKRGSLVRCAFCFANIKGWEIGDKAMEEHKTYNPNCRFILGLPVGNIPLPPPLNYQYEEVRLKSFANWPISDIITPQELAAAGLYYTQDRDTVKCIFCCELVSNWEPGDKAIVKHRSNYPHCRFIQGLPAGDFPKKSPIEYERKEVRLGTYTEWPVPHIVTPEDLASAGFYYTQRGDLVICAFCSAAVYNWKTGDIPLKEHLSCNPSCRYIEEKQVSLNFELPQFNDSNMNISPNNGNSAQALHHISDTLQTVIDKLEEENKCLKDARQCKICMDADINTVILPCGHLVVCVSCADGLNICPTCRVVVQTTVRTYL